MTHTLRARRRLASSRFEALPGNLRGAAWLLVASLFFAGMTALVKLAGARDISVAQILFVRQAVMFATVLPYLASHFPQAVVTHRLRLHLARVALAVVAMYAGFSAVVHIPLAQATAIGFAKSFFVTVFAILFLGEIVGWRRWSATIIGFLGVVVMLRPGADGIDVYALAAVVGAAAAGLVMIIIRILSRDEAPVTILTYQAALVGVVMMPFALWQWVWPTPEEWVLLVSIGLVSLIAQSCNIRAFRDGEATVLASLDYMRLLWATLLGILVFAELPHVTTFVGGAIVIAAALYTVQRERAQGRKLSRSPQGRGYST